MSTARELLELATDAYKRVLQGQTVKMGDRMVTLAELPQISKEIDKLKREVTAEDARAAGRSNPGIALADFS